MKAVLNLIILNFKILIQSFIINNRLIKKHNHMANIPAGFLFKLNLLYLNTFTWFILIGGKR